jgi:site-specific DNA recombinase
MEMGSGRKPRQAGGYVRISDDPSEEEKGVTRQKEDVAELAARLGWTLGKVYQENDTSAYRKKRIRLADGRSVWRVVRPEFRQMLQDYEDGVIDGIIVYDLERLARQPRDLEDLIDLVDHFKRPVVGVTGALDLMTENGKTMARVLVAMANKSSADTARRVARERLQRAQEGRSLSSRRAFGWQADRITIEPSEAAVVRGAIKRFTDGESWNSVTQWITETGVPPVGGGRWYLASVKKVILNPRVAGLTVYNGAFRTPDANATGGQEPGDGKRLAPSPRDRAVRDAHGAYVPGPHKAIVTVEQWEALIDEWERRREGREFTAQNTRRYLLSGLLRCGRPREDGTLCSKTLVGITTRRAKGGPDMTLYKCPNKGNGGCGGTQRHMARLDALIEDLLFLHLQTNQPEDTGPEPEPEQDDPAATELEDVRNRLKLMRAGMRDGTVSTETFFAVVPALETREKKLTADLARVRRHRSARNRQMRTAQEVRAEWDAPDTTLAGRRALLGQYLSAIIVHPAKRAGGPGSFDYEAIEPVWKAMP